MKIVFIRRGWKMGTVNWPIPPRVGDKIDPDHPAFAGVRGTNFETHHDMDIERVTYKKNHVEVEIE